MKTTCLQNTAFFYTWETSLISTNTGSKNREFVLGILSSRDGSFLTLVQVY